MGSSNVWESVALYYVTDSPEANGQTVSAQSGAGSTQEIFIGARTGQCPHET